MFVKWVSLDLVGMMAGDLTTSKKVKQGRRTASNDISDNDDPRAETIHSGNQGRTAEACILALVYSETSAMIKL